MHNNDNSANIEKYWLMFWNDLLKEMKECEWNKKYKELLEKYPNCVERKTEPDFTVEAALNIIQEMAKETGQVGTVVESLLSIARLTGITTKNGLEILYTPDNQMIFKLMEEKCAKIAKETENKDKKIKANLCVKWIPKLMNYCEEMINKFSVVLHGINITKFAKETAGRESVYVISKLTELIDNKNLNLSTKQMEEVVEAIKRLH